MERYILFVIEGPFRNLSGKDAEGWIRRNQSTLIHFLVKSVRTIVERQTFVSSKQDLSHSASFPLNEGVYWAAVSWKELGGPKARFDVSTSSWNGDLSELDKTLNTLLEVETRALKDSIVQDLSPLYELLGRLPPHGTYALDVVWLTQNTDLSNEMYDEFTDLLLWVKVCHDGKITVVSCTETATLPCKFDGVSGIKSLLAKDLANPVSPNCDLLDPELCWRGHLKLNIPGVEDGGSLSYQIQLRLDDLDKILHDIDGKKSSLSNSNPKRVYFDRVCEVFAICDVRTVPECFCTGSSLVLCPCEEGDALREAFFNIQNVAVMMRLACSDSPLREAAPKWTSRDFDNVLLSSRELVEPRTVECDASSYLYFLAFKDDTLGGGQLSLISMKNPAQLQHIASVYARERRQYQESGPPKSSMKNYPAPFLSGSALWQVERKLRSLQAEALRRWIDVQRQKDPDYILEEAVRNEILQQVVIQTLKTNRNDLIQTCWKEDPRALEPLKTWQGHNLEDPKDWPERKALERQLRRSQNVNPVAKQNTLLAPRANATLINPEEISRRFDKQGRLIPGRQKQVTPQKCHCKPSISLEEAKTTPWPDALGCNYHGVSYNVNKECEIAEQRRSKLQEKLVNDETGSWCNPWSCNQSDVCIILPERTTRTPRKNPPLDEAVRKSPRLLAKSQPLSDGVSTRARKSNDEKRQQQMTQKSSTRTTFNENLKAAIVKCLSEQGLDTTHTLFRTCANKLSVICRTLLKGSDPQTLSLRQMYQVAKANAKQVVQMEMNFVK